MVVSAPAQSPFESQKGPSRPPLHSGDHLSRAEFRRRYALYPEIKKAELIEGVVIVGSPVHRQHGRPHFQFVSILGTYTAHTPGLVAGDYESVVLDEDNEVQPDLFVGIDSTQGGQLTDAEKGPLAGVPEFIVEIAASSASYDLHSKFDVYLRSGVREYLVLLAYEREMRFFRLEDGEFREVLPDEDGVTRSQILPGFWFRSDWFWEGKMSELLQLVQEGLASREHREFAAKLAAR